MCCHITTLRALCVWQEIFGPVLSVYVYPEKDYKEVLQLIDNTSPYALTGAVYAQDKYDSFTHCLFLLRPASLLKSL